MRRQSISKTLTTKTYQIHTDGRTVWINGLTQLLGRFSKTGIDVHVDGTCVGDSCSPGPCTLEHWRTFQKKMMEFHKVGVPYRFRPNYLKAEQ